MGKPSAPAAPDPQETAQAQTGTNIGTAIANNYMGMVGQNTPYGSLTYSQTGTYSYTDPYTGQTYELPQYTANTTLSPEQQAILKQNNQTQLNLATTGANQSAFLQDYLGRPANFDTSAIEGRLTELGSRRLDPRFEQERNALSARLANQGIAPGSEAYAREMTALDQSKNDAYNQLYLTGRGQAFNEIAAERNQPINEISALLSGSQVSSPNFGIAQPQGAATTDVAGLINTNYQNQYNNYTNQMAQRQSLLGGLFGAAGTIMGAPAGSLAGRLFSDRRLKEDIKAVGKTDDGLTVYTYRYKGQPTVQMGVMAQDVEKKTPDAVKTINGFKSVDYGKVA